MATNAELLAAIDTALVAILQGGVASYTVAGRTFTKLDVDKLMKWRISLQGDDETTGGPRVTHTSFSGFRG